jgi:hypothetical protein
MNKRKKTLRQNNRLAHTVSREFDRHFCRIGLARREYKGIRLLGARFRTEVLSSVLLHCKFATPDQVDALLHPLPYSDGLTATDKPNLPGLRPPTLYPKFTKADGPSENSGVCLQIRDYHPGAYCPLRQDVPEHD